MICNFSICTQGGNREIKSLTKVLQAWYGEEVKLFLSTDTLESYPLEFLGWFPQNPTLTLEADLILSDPLPVLRELRKQPLSIDVWYEWLDRRTVVETKTFSIKNYVYA